MFSYLSQQYPSERLRQPDAILTADLDVLFGCSAIRAVPERLAEHDKTTFLQAHEMRWARVFRL
jgi:hypothetical protein